MEAGRARRPCATSRDGEAIVSDSFASDHGLEVGDRFRLLSQTGGRPSFRGRRRVRLEARRLRQRPHHPGRCWRATSTRPRTRSTSSRPSRAPTPPRSRRCSPDGVEARLPDRRSAQPAGTEGKPRRTGRPARQPGLRAARAGDRDLALRDRQHAGALDPRTHPRAGDAAGDRHVAAPGADDDPLRGGDHGADRRDPRHGPRA